MNTVDRGTKLKFLGTLFKLVPEACQQGVIGALAYEGVRLLLPYVIHAAAD